VSWDGEEKKDDLRRRVHHRQVFLWHHPEQTIAKSLARWGISSAHQNYTVRTHEHSTMAFRIPQLKPGTLSLPLAVPRELLV